MAAEFEGETPMNSQPVSPASEYLSSSILSLSIIAVLEFGVPIDNPILRARSLLRDLFLPVNPRFSSIMITNAKGAKKWRPVQVNLDDHIKVPTFPTNKPTQFYDKCLDEYLSNLGTSPFPESKPLWEVHIIKYPTTHAAGGNVVFRLHHSLGDGFSLMGALLSCLRRADDPSLPLTFPSVVVRSGHEGKNGNGVAKLVSLVANTVSDVWSTVFRRREDGKSAVRSGHEGVEFLASSIVTMCFSMDDVKKIKLKLGGVTINDVICGAIFLGVRVYMEEEEEADGTTKSSANTTMTSLVLFNTRMVGGYKSVEEMLEPGPELPWGNNFTFLTVSVPELPPAEKGGPVRNPLEFVLETHQLVKRKRNSIGLFLTAKYLQLVRKLRGPEAVSKYLYDVIKNSSLGITNVVGPIEKMSLGGYPVEGLYFVVPGAPHGMVIGVISYANQLRVAVKVEKDFVDAQKLKSCIEQSFAKMLQASC